MSSGCIRVAAYRTREACVSSVVATHEKRLRVLDIPLVQLAAFVNNKCPFVCAYSDSKQS